MKEKLYTKRLSYTLIITLQEGREEGIVEERATER